MSHRFKFQRELELCQEANKSAGQSLVNKFITHQEESINGSNHPYGRLVYCHFRSVKEQTQDNVEKPFQSERGDLARRDQRCYFKDSSLRIYSRGGSEYVVPLVFNVEEVYPIENGVIVKVRHNRDKLLFDPTHSDSSSINGSLFGRKPTLKEWTYLTITEHPLDDIHPLSILTSQAPIFEGQLSQNPVLLNLIQTPLEILKVCYKIPVVVMFNPQNQQIIFGLLKHSTEMARSSGGDEPMHPEDSSYIRSIEPDSRHPEIFNISREPKLVVQEVCSVSGGKGVPRVIVERGLASNYELNIGLYYEAAKVYEVYQADVRNLNSFKLVLSLNGVQDVSELTFLTSSSTEEVEIIKVSTAKQITNKQNQQRSVDVDVLTQRLKLLGHKQTLVLMHSQTNNSLIHIYQGATPLLWNLDVAELSGSILSDKTKAQPKIESLMNAQGSAITLGLSNGQQRRVNLRLRVDDYLVKSVLKCLKKIVPANLYESLVQDYYEVLVKSSQHEGDQFTLLMNLLQAILTGDHSKFAFMLPPSQRSAIQQVHTPTSGSNSGSQQMTPQPATSSKNATPTQTLQTKILRSSTTSFGPDSAASRRKAPGVTGQATQPTSFTQLAQQQQVKSTVLGRQASGGAANLSSQQPRKFVVASSSAPNQAESQQANNLHPLSANPFADMLNSDFHKEFFSSEYASLFPEDMVLIAPAPYIAEQSHSTVAQPVHISSPTKATTPTKSLQVGMKLAQQKSTQPIEKKMSNTIHTPTSPTSNKVAPASFIIAFKTQRVNLYQHFSSFFSVLHLLYEDLKLNKLRDAVESHRLAQAIISLALLIEPYKKAAYVEYYIKAERDFINAEEVEVMMKRAYKDGSSTKEGVEIEPVPKLVQWLSQALDGGQHNSLLSYPFPLFFEETRKIVRIYEILTGSQSHSYLHPALLHSRLNQVNGQLLEGLIHFKRKTSEIIDYREYLKGNGFGTQILHLFEKVLFAIREENLTLEHIKRLPSIISLPILEIIRNARLFLQDIQTVPQWPDSIYRMIQREDILNNKRLFEKGAAEPSPISLNRGFSTVPPKDSNDDQKYRNDMESLMQRMAAEYINIGGSGEPETKVKLQNDADAQLKSNNNNKIIDFLKNRFSSDTRFKEVTNFLNCSAELIIKLEHIPNRETMTEEQLTAERQKLLDKMFTRQLSKSIGRGALQFGTVQTLPTETLKVPKINHTGYAPLTESYMQVEFKDDASKEILQWPEFHNGVASALKIALSFSKNRGPGTADISQVQHTRNWIMYHKPAEPKFEHGGFCLAMGLLGQFDTLQPTDIYQHLKSTHDATTIGILLGRAASKIGSMDDHDTRTLCIHIPYLLPPTLNLEVSLSVQSAAVIGAGLLYKGTSNRLMTEMLLAQIGRKPLSDKAIEREGYALASGIALGLVNLGIGNKMQGLVDLKLDERLLRYVEGGKNIDLPQSMLSQNFNHDNTKCSSIKEGDMVNVHITSQGALIALALIHLKSGNKQITDALLMPQTFYSLESVRPSFLLLKVLAKNLILWDEIDCSKEWVESQIPMIIHDIYTSDISTAELKYQQKLIEDGIDYSTVSLCYVNIIAGAVFSVGFKFAGTGSKDAFNLVLSYFSFFKKLKIIQQNKDAIGIIHTNLTKNQIDKNTLETCLCVCAFAMSLVMAGTGDVDCFRTLRVLRKRFEQDMHYGYNMAINMSLGFLFLGSGAFTFSRNNLAIASLLCALYPVFPQNASDNRYHLQALRHFYVLSIESRLIQARDIDTGEFLNVKMDVEVVETQETSARMTDCPDLQSPKVISITTPDIVNAKIKTISVSTEKYHEVNIKMSGEAEEQQKHFTGGQDKRQKIFEQFDFQKIIYLKKRADATTSQSQIAPQIMVEEAKLNEDMVKLVSNYDRTAVGTVEDFGSLSSLSSVVKDQSIKIMLTNFFKVSADSEDATFTEIEDVLLAQSKDSYTMLSPPEFFRIQGLYESIQDVLKSSYLPYTYSEKLKVLDKVKGLNLHSQFEFLSFNLDHLLTGITDGEKQSIAMELAGSYQSFKCSKDAYQQFSDGTVLNVSPQSNVTNYTRLREQIVKQFTSFPSILMASQHINLDLNELFVAKTVTDTIMNQIRMKGPAESEIVKRYRFSKINGLRVDNQNDSELNMIIASALKQLIGTRLGGNSDSLIDEVLIPAFILADK